MPELAHVFEPLRNNEHEEAKKKISPPAKSADVIPIDQKAREAEGKNFASYENLGGILDEAEYQALLNHVSAAGTGEASVAEYARQNARKAKITVSPEAFNMYAVLRQDDKSEETIKLASMSDQQLLAEILRIKGEAEALKQLKEFFRL